ncbi:MULTISPECIES: helix-turn-helix domain-containing protein [unclassified Paenibacillus]|uniref:helix-turn-helix domain-containing protein n=1 Tax=unclassified Paenibacillus TaxID=185978 RepID=UPI001043EC01|nr:MULTISPECIES: helix-turn-helix domain-containing protein [unclassified Paenibacillus]NIK68085.1 AraC-like DNA-binding protein [Paenibacillus sp. BK720]TCM99696.1 AraC-like protein [Paenibacillus sp. BK033]
MKPVRASDAYHNSQLICTYSGYKPANMHKWGPGVRDVYALHFIISGKGTLETRNQRFSLKAADSFMIFPQTEIYYYPDPEDPWEYIWIEFKGDEAGRLVGMTEMERDNPVAGASPHDLKPYFPAAPRADARPFERIRAGAQLRLLLSYYLEFYPRESQPADYVKMAKEYIIINYWRANLTVSDIVNAVSLERSYLFRLFKEAAGMSVSRYLTAYRIERARELLESSVLSVKSVAYSVGYKDQLYFSKVFKKATSYTPSEYMTLHGRTEIL